jgi:AcrR family transcriptional regulator
MDTRTKILTEAGILFTRMGIRSITMDFLADHLGMSKRTIYENFKDKDEIVLHSLIRGLNEHAQEFNRIIEKSSNVIEAIYNIGKKNHDTFSQINPVFFHDLKKYYRDIHDLLVEKGGVSSSDTNLMLLKKGINEGIFKKELNIELVDVFLQKIMEFFHDESPFYVAERFSKKDVLQTILKPYLTGICTKKGLEILDKHEDFFVNY